MGAAPHRRMMHRAGWVRLGPHPHAGCAPAAPWGARGAWWAWWAGAAIPRRACAPPWPG